MARKKRTDAEAAPKQQESQTAAQPPEEHADSVPPAVAEQRSFPVAGLCASAGGLDAFKKFFSTMPADSGVAFVLLPHLAPTHESLMVELLARHTSMPVEQAMEGMEVKPNHVYVIPPNKFMTIEKGGLRLTGSSNRTATSFDLFLRSLADDQQERAICIIFSGTGSHGVAGLKAVKSNGGMVMVQTPSTAEYDRMPLSAVATGLADYVLPPEKMPPELVKFVRHPYIGRGSEEKAGEQEAGDRLQRLLVFLRGRSKRDFRCYRKRMLLRRIERRMGLHQIGTIDEYLEFLREHPDETRQLARDLLISVTNFFRDADAFAALQTQVIAPLVEQKDNDVPIRVWCPGAATGEEPYSIGILIMEQLALARKQCPVQIFATDIDEQALEVGRQGIYNESILADISSERLARFFTKADENAYRIRKDLRESVVFAVQNLIADAPFSRIDLISCRNLLIYLEPEVQKKIVTLLHFALNEGGYLFLGPSETVGRHTDLFEQVDKRWRIFRRIGPTRRDLVDFPIVTGEHRELMVPAREGRARMSLVPRPVDYGELTRANLLELFAPASVTVDHRNQILYYHGRTVQYLNTPSGTPTHELLALARPELRSKLRTVVASARRDNHEVTEVAARVPRNGSRVSVSITARPVHGPRVAEGVLLVTFQDVASTSAAAQKPPPEPDEGMRQLEHELKGTREDLQATIAELEGSNEELRIANEEVMSMNEELQSANEELETSKEELQALNEELETSKEELQSLNEELSTVNSQLQEKVHELEGVNNDMTNLFNCTDIATIFLDPQFCVKRFTPAATSLFALIATDVGRPLNDIVPSVNDPDLKADAEEVLHSLIPREQEISSDRGKRYIRRITPYRTADRHIEGIIITFVDVTSSKLAEQALRDSEERFRVAVDSAPNALVIFDGKGKIVLANKQTEVLFGYRHDELIGQALESLVPERYRGDYPELRAEFFANPQQRPMGAGRDLYCRHKNGSEFSVEIGLSPIRIKGEVSCLASIVDITQRKQNEQRLRELTAALEERVAERTQALRLSQERMRAIVESASEGIITIDEAGVIRDFNRSAERIFGYTAAEIVGQNVRVLVPPLFDLEQHSDSAGVLGASGEVLGQRKDGTVFPLEMAVNQFREGDKQLYAGIMRDNSERRALENEVQQIASNEQQRIGRDLHDSVGQEVTGLSILADNLAHDLTDASARQQADKISAGLRELLRQIRDLSHGLIPVAGGRAGLINALSSLSERVAEQSGVECTFAHPQQVLVDDQNVAVHLFRIAQEAIANSLRHGKPKKIDIGLTLKDGWLTLLIEDDGTGLPPEPRDSKGNGLRIMRHRASLINGLLDVASRKGGGVRVSCRVKLP